MPTNRRKVRDEEDAWELLEDWQESGSDMRDFCARRGVDGRSLNCWRMKLCKPTDKVEPGGLRLVEVVGSRTVASRKAEYRVSVGPFVIEVDDDFRDDTLARLLRVAATC